jgi:signal transduction histidine kinase
MLGKLITKLHEFHHGESSAMCLNRLSLFLKNYKEIDPKDVETIRRFNLVIDEFINITSKDILQLGDLGYEFLTVYKVNKYYNKGNDLKSKLASSVDYLNRLLVDIRKQTNDDFIKPNVAEQIVNTIDKIRRNIKEINLSINESISSSLTEVLNNIREKYSGNTNYPVNISYDQLTINDIKVIIPKEELEKVLVIILQNSFESYLTKDALLQVQMTVTKIDNNVCIKIEDFGTGIKKEDLSRIYEKGFTTKSKGHGFGLYFVKSTLENYGGKIEVDSEYGAGTRVTIYLCVG